MAEVVIPVDNEKTSKVDHPWVSERERLKNIAALLEPNHCLWMVFCNLEPDKDYSRDHDGIHKS
jgi:hypothetical protein